MHTTRSTALTLRALALSATALCTLGLTACGGDDGGGGGKGDEVTNPMVIEQGKATATATTQLGSIMPGADASAAQGPVMQVGNSMNTLVTQFRSVKLQEQAGAGAGPAAYGQGQATENQFSFADDHLSANLIYNQSNISFSYVVELDMPVVDGGRQFDGTFDLNYDATSAQYTIKYGYSGVYEGFKTDTAGCAVSGTIGIDYLWDVSGPLFDQLPADQRAAVKDQMGGDGRVTLEFGPNCGDVKVFGK